MRCLLTVTQHTVLRTLHGALQQRKSSIERRKTGKTVRREMVVVESQETSSQISRTLRRISPSEKLQHTLQSARRVESGRTRFRHQLPTKPVRPNAERTWLPLWEGARPRRCISEHTLNAESGRNWARRSATYACCPRRPVCTSGQRRRWAGETERPHHQPCSPSRFLTSHRRNFC